MAGKLLLSRHNATVVRSHGCFLGQCSVVYSLWLRRDKGGGTLFSRSRGRSGDSDSLLGRSRD
jgi:hypothetical protein